MTATTTTTTHAHTHIHTNTHTHTHTHTRNIHVAYMKVVRNWAKRIAVDSTQAPTPTLPSGIGRPPRQDTENRKNSPPTFEMLFSKRKSRANNSKFCLGQRTTTMCVHWFLVKPAQKGENLLISFLFLYLVFSFWCAVDKRTPKFSTQ